METTVILNNGRSFVGHVVPNGDDRIIFVYLNGVSLIEGFDAFRFPENTSRIIMNVDVSTIRVYEGYTEIIAINSEFGNCNITLKKGSD